MYRTQFLYSFELYADVTDNHIQSVLLFKDMVFIATLYLFLQFILNTHVKQFQMQTFGIYGF